MNKKFTITIATKNRLDDLKITLEKLAAAVDFSSVSIIICDDASSDGTLEYILGEYPEIEIFKNARSKGIHHARNQMMKRVATPFAISIDDDVHLITRDSMRIIEDYFCSHPTCAIAAFRIFWSTSEPASQTTRQMPQRVKSFGAGASAWRMAAWNAIPDYPEWFVFYGEEDFAAQHLFKRNWEVHYLPAVLAHHRVDLKSRQKHGDYRLRLRRSLRAGWYLYFLFSPLREIPGLMAYSIWAQLKLKVFKGDFQALAALCQALCDLFFSMPRLVRQSNRFSKEEYGHYQQLLPARLYWKPGE